MSAHRRMFAFWALILQGVVWADASGTVTVNTGQNFSFDSGTTSSSGADIQYTGASITFQGSATGISGSAYGLTGSTVYGSVTQQILSGLGSFFASAPLSGSSLAPNAIFAVHTNKGNYAKALITASSSSSIAFQYTTYGATTGGGGGGPTITQILNNYSLTPAGFANSGIAQGSLFIIKGSGLADANAPALPLQDSSKGLPTTLNGASVKIVDASGAALTPVFYYAIASQLALVLPSNTAVGTAQVTATYNNQTSAAFSIQAVESAMGFDAYYGAGAGLGVATNNATGALYNYGNSIPPGATVVLWGSGLGADPQRDKTFVEGAFPIHGLAHVYVGGVDAPIVYQGASGYPGLNQVDVTIPTNSPTGCNVSLVGVTAAGVPTNFLTLPIGTGACSDSAFGITGSQSQSLSGQSTVKTGFLSLFHSTSPAASGAGAQVSDGAIATFQSVAGSAYGSASGSVSIPGCIVTQTVNGGGAASTGLDAGSITVTGPSGSATMNQLPQVPGEYLAQIASGFIPASGGSFAFHGSGGANVGGFDTSVVFPNPLLSWTNQSAAATVNRSSGLQFTWTSGAPGALVFMSGNSSGAAGQFASFTCIAPVEALAFTVPNYVTGILPAGSGIVTLANYTNFKTFTATGLDFASSAGYVSYSINATYQ